MNLYRIDLTDPSGRYVGSVSDLIGPRLIRSHSEAREAALGAANAGIFAHIVRIRSAGSLLRVGIVAPNSSRVARCADHFVPSIVNP